MPRPRKAATTVLGEHLDKAAARLGGLKQLQAALGQAGAVVRLRTIHAWRFGEYWPDTTHHSAIAEVCGVGGQEIGSMIVRVTTVAREGEMAVCRRQPQQTTAKGWAQFWKINVKREWSRASKCLLVMKDDPRSDGSGFEVMLLEKDPEQISFGRGFNENGNVRFVMYSNYADRIFFGQRNDEGSLRTQGYLIESHRYAMVSLYFWNGLICDLDEFFADAPDLVANELPALLFQLFCEHDENKPIPQELLQSFEATEEVELRTNSYFELDGGGGPIETPNALFWCTERPTRRN